MKKNILGAMPDVKECSGGVDAKLSYFIPISDIKPDKPFEFNEKGEIIRLNIKRKGTYRGKRYDRNFHKMPGYEEESE